MRKKTVEEYVETIYILEKKGKRVHTGDISYEMGVKPPSVTEMLQKLKADSLVDYQSYSGVLLTQKGRELAKDLMKKHNVIGNFLEIIGVEHDIAQVDACQIEHHVSEKTMRQLEKFVQFVNETPETPRWIIRFNKFCELGKIEICDRCNKCK